jgi:hypothetical protein
MKKTNVLTLTLTIAVMVFGLMACGSGNDRAAKDLAEVLSRPELPFNISAQDQGAAKEGPGHLVTFKDAVFRINPEFIKTVNPQAAQNMSVEGFKDLHVTAKSVVFYYEKKKALEIRRISGFHFSMDEALVTKLVSKDPKGTFNMSVSVDEMEAEGYNLTPFLNKDLKTPKELFAAMMQNGQRQVFKTKGFAFDLKGRNTAAEGENHFSGKASLSDMQISQQVNGQIMQKLYGKPEDISADLFVNALKDNQTLFDVAFALTDLKVEGLTQGQDGEKKFDFIGKKFDLTYKIAPNPEKTAFVLSTTSHIEGMTIDVPQKPEIAKLTQIEKLVTEFNFKPISPALALTYMQFMHSAMNADQSQEEGKQKFEQDMKQQGMAAMGELMQSRPSVHFKVSPLIHPWTTLEGQADLSMAGMTPVGKVLLSVTKASSLVDTVARELNLEKIKLKDLAEFISKYLIIAEDGTGSMTLEMNQDKPGTPIINGK